MKSPRRVRLVLVAACLGWLMLLSGCVTVPCACDLTCVAEKVEQRTGIAPGPAPLDGSIFWPNGAALGDGLQEDEAVLIALWNNALFHEMLTDLGIARGDLVQAGLLPNPEVIYFFPVTHKPYKYALEVPIEAFWLRPIRVRAAVRESARACDRLTQTALDLIRDVRLAYADLLLARGQVQVAEESVRIRGETDRLAEARLKAGDIGVQDAATARIDYLRAEQDLWCVRFEVSVAEERLRNLMGIGTDRTPLKPDSPPAPSRTDLDAEALTAEAVTSRPDALAAEEAVVAAAERLRLARVGWIRFLGLADASSGRNTGHELGPAFRVTLPIFNWNQGTIARAEAELERAERQRLTVRNQIILDVHQSHFRYTQARAEFEVLDTKVRPEVEASIRRSEQAFREGNASYLLVLEATRQLLDNRLRGEQLRADLRRAWAELERSVGRRLTDPPPPPAPAGDATP